MRFHKDSIDRFFDYDIHVETRTIFISDMEDGIGVGPLMAERLLKALHLLAAQDKEKPIKIILNSKGGNWDDGMACYDAIAACPCHVTIEVYGSCMSMATVILQAADARVLAQNSTFMIHDGSDFFEGEAKSFERWGERSKKIRTRMYEIYSERSKKDARFWQKKCASDLILTAQEAIDLGLADKILGEEDEGDKS